MSIEEQCPWHKKVCPVYVKMSSSDDNHKMNAPQHAEVTVQKDDGDLEVISKMNPVIADIARHLNDPVQTKAMADFARGKLSYAEMRGLCG